MIASDRPAEEGTPEHTKGDGDHGHHPHYMLTLYVSGASPRSLRAIDSVRAVCDEHLHGEVGFEVVDVHQSPGRLIEDRVIAAPTVVKRLPPPLCQLVGDLTDLDRVLVALQVTTTRAGPLAASEQVGDDDDEH